MGRFAAVTVQGRWPRPGRWLQQPGLTDALLSGKGFGLFFVFVEWTSSSEAGLWPAQAAKEPTGRPSERRRQRGTCSPEHVPRNAALGH